MKKTLRLILLFIILINCKKNEVLEKAPSDFYFTITYSFTDYYNSKTKYLVRSLDSDGSKDSVKIELTKNEIDSIYNFIKKIDFTNMPEVIGEKCRMSICVRDYIGVFMKNQYKEISFYHNESFFQSANSRNILHLNSLLKKTLKKRQKMIDTLPQSEAYLE